MVRGSKGLAACAILGSACSAARSRVGSGDRDAAPGGWDAAPRAASVPAGRREPGATPVGCCPPIPGGARLMGPRRAAARPGASLPAGSVSPKSLCQLGHCTRMAPGDSRHPQKKLTSRGHKATIPGDTSPWRSQVMRDQGEVSPGERGGHNRDAGGWDAAPSPLLLAHN